MKQKAPKGNFMLRRQHAAFKPKTCIIGVKS